MKRLPGGRDAPTVLTTAGSFLRTLLGYVGYWLLHGLAFAALVASLVPLRWAEVPTMIGAFAGSFVVGYLVLFAPAGLGIREGALATLLSSHWSGRTALVTSIVSRVWIIVGEVLSVIIHGVMERRTR